MEFMKFDEAGIAKAADILNKGGVVVIPTDTVYGLAAHPAFPDAVARLYTIKGRAAAKPIALLAADVAAVAKFGAKLEGDAKTLGEKYWPGALTLVLPCGQGYEGFRVPDLDGTRDLLRRCGGVLRVTSANLSGQRAATDAPEALKSIGLDCDLVLDGGVSPGGVPSTVVKIDPAGTRTILREGAIKLPRE